MNLGAIKANERQLLTLNTNGINEDWHFEVESKLSHRMSDYGLRVDGDRIEFAFTSSPKLGTQVEFYEVRDSDTKDVIFPLGIEYESVADTHLDSSHVNFGRGVTFSKLIS